MITHSVGTIAHPRALRAKVVKVRCIYYKCTADLLQPQAQLPAAVQLITAPASSRSPLLTCIMTANTTVIIESTPIISQLFEASVFVHSVVASITANGTGVPAIFRQLQQLQHATTVAVCRSDAQQVSVDPLDQLRRHI